VNTPSPTEVRHTTTARASRSVQFVVCERHRLIYRPLAKCASTTVIDFLGDLGGHGQKRDRRSFLPLKSGAVGPGSGDAYEIRCPADMLAGLVGRYADYVWFSVVREPYGRVTSNYFNKLNRYARRFEPQVYFATYLRQLLAGRAVWRQGHEEDRAARMRTRISFPRFVTGLRDHGIDWDVHVALQTDLLRGDLVPYHRLIRMENLAAGLREVVAEAGATDAATAALEGLKRLNQSSASSAVDRIQWTPECRRIVADLYRRDFDELGYAA
jgi:hypothetical protein